MWNNRYDQQLLTLMQVYDAIPDQTYISFNDLADSTGLSDKKLTALLAQLAHKRIIANKASEYTESKYKYFREVTKRSRDRTTVQLKVRLLVEYLNTRRHYPTDMVLIALEEHDHPMCFAELMTHTGLTEHTLNVLLRALIRTGAVERIRTGVTFKYKIK